MCRLIFIAMIAMILMKNQPYHRYHRYTPIPPPNATPLRLQPPGPMLPVTTSILFRKLLYSRLILDSNPPMLKVTCLQPNCGYSPTPQPLGQTSTGNLWKHYTQRHPAIAYAVKNDKNTLSSPSSSASSFFEPRNLQIQSRNPVIQLARPSNNTAKYRELLLLFEVYRIRCCYRSLD